MSEFRLHMRWEGDCLVPANAFWQRVADKNLVVGESYTFVEDHERSEKSHKHYFASIKDAWANLPEDLAERFMTPDHLRKYALIKCGYYEERTFIASSKAEARRIAAWTKPSDGFSIVSVNENVVIERTALSQKTKAMGRKRFQQSKTDVLEFVASLVGIAREELEANAARAA